jgi:hypothetical protein
MKRKGIMPMTLYTLIGLALTAATMVIVITLVMYFIK